MDTPQLAYLLAGGRSPGEEDEAAADAIAEALDLALLIEGADLEAVSSAEEAVRLSGSDARALTPPLLDGLIDHLRELSHAAAVAADELAGRR